jgi:hypothetical protein
MPLRIRRPGRSLTEIGITANALELRIVDNERNFQAGRGKQCIERLAAGMNAPTRRK